MTFPQFFNLIIAGLLVVFAVNSVLAVILIRRKSRHPNIAWMCLGISATGTVAYLFALVYRNIFAGGQPSVIVSAANLAWAVFVAVNIFTILRLFRNGHD